MYAKASRSRGGNDEVRTASAHHDGRALPHREEAMARSRLLHDTCSARSGGQRPIAPFALALGVRWRRRWRRLSTAAACVCEQGARLHRSAFTYAIAVTTLLLEVAPNVIERPRWNLAAFSVVATLITHGLLLDGRELPSTFLFAVTTGFTAAMLRIYVF